MLRDISHTVAKNTDNEYDWRKYRNLRNKYNNEVKKSKNKYYTSKLTIQDKECKKDKILKNEYKIDNKLWTTVKDITNS